MSNAYRTAIARKKPSKPVKALEADGRIVGRVLDYGLSLIHISEPTRPY